MITFIELCIHVDSTGILHLLMLGLLRMITFIKLCIHMDSTGHVLYLWLKSISMTRASLFTAKH